MTFPIRTTCLGLLALGISTPALAQNKYQVTEEERAACQDDAVRLCSSAYPNEDALLSCMRGNQARLTATCRPVFVAGLRRRGIE